MTQRSATRRAQRAEARRRARLIARGELEDDAVAEDEGPSDERRERPGFLQRLFPPAPPLPGKPDPLAGFTYQGRLRPVVANLWLLRRNPLSWTIPGLVWAAGFALAGPDYGFLATMFSYAALIAAGWFGWQRPALYGASAAFVGYVLFVAIAFVFFEARFGVNPVTEIASPIEAVASLGVQGALYVLIGLVSGWYGGYLRRRQADVSRQQANRARR